MEDAKNHAIAAPAPACREKYWDERSIEEKLDALRDALVNQLQLQKSIEIVFNNLLAHSHSEGKLVVGIGETVSNSHNKYYLGRVPSSLKKSTDRS